MKRVKKPTGKAGSGAQGDGALRRLAQGTFRTLRDAEKYDLGPQALMILGLAEATLARFLEAKAIIDRDGLTVIGAKGQVVKHPALSAESSARADLVKLLGQLAIEG